MASGSYYEEYMRSKAYVRSGNDETKRLLTDRNAYISYLEIQLERVSAACLNTDAMEKKFNTLSSNVRGIEEKLNNVSRVSKLTHSFADEETSKNTSKITTMETKLGAMDGSTEKMWQDIQYLKERNSKLEDRVKEAEGKVQKDLSEAVQRMNQVCSRIEDRVEQLHSQLITQDSRLNTLTTTQNDTRGSLTTVESRAREFVAREIQTLQHDISTGRDLMNSKLIELEEKVKKSADKQLKQQTVQLAKVSCSTEDRIELIESRLESVQQQQAHHQIQQQNLARSHQEGQNMINQNILALQDDIAQSSCVKSSSNSNLSAVELTRIDRKVGSLNKTIELRLQQVEKESSQLRNAFECIKTVTERDLTQRIVKAEQAVRDIAMESMERAENQSQKVLSTLDEIENKVKREIKMSLPLSTTSDGSFKELRQELVKQTNQLQGSIESKLDTAIEQVS